MEPSLPIPETRWTRRRSGWRATWILAPTVLTFLSVYCVSLPADHGEASSVPPVRVLLRRLEGETSLRFVATQPIGARTTSGRELLSQDEGRHEVTLEAGRDTLRLDGQSLEVSQIILSSEAPFELGDRHYRGDIMVAVDDGGRLRAVNRIDLETYLCGVVGSEIPAYSAIESLKAQAVAARTYTLWRMAGNSRRSYDLTDDTYSQVYSGALDVSDRVVTAVQATRGQVLAYDGKFLPAYYHSTCGGHTSDQRVGFGSGEALAPLSGAPCGYCTSSRYYEWTATVPKKTVDEKLGKNGPVRSIRPLDRDEGGRWWRAEIEGEGWRREVSANYLRTQLGSNKLRGAIIETLEIEGDEWVVKGRGWGHGVGMCQVGAMTLGKEKGWSYRQILSHYYPGAVLREAPSTGSGWRIAPE
ncbi:MAG: SpoIID/LytB domain-containing protein [Planctomycetota bacterium]